MLPLSLVHQREEASGERPRGTRSTLPAARMQSKQRRRRERPRLFSLSPDARAKRIPSPVTLFSSSARPRPAGPGLFENAKTVAQPQGVDQSGAVAAARAVAVLRVFFYVLALRRSRSATNPIPPTRSHRQGTDHGPFACLGLPSCPACARCSHPCASMIAFMVSPGSEHQ